MSNPGVRVNCAACNGTGSLLFQICAACDGKGKLRSQTPQGIVIAATVRDTFPGSIPFSSAQDAAVLDGL